MVSLVLNNRAVLVAIVYESLLNSTKMDIRLPTLSLAISD